MAIIILTRYFAPRLLRCVCVGFATDTYGGTNQVSFFLSDIEFITRADAERGGEYLNDSPWDSSQPDYLPPNWFYLKGDVIEGACTVDCGGARKLVVDTPDFQDYFDPDQRDPTSFLSIFLSRYYSMLANEPDFWTDMAMIHGRGPPSWQNCAESTGDFRCGSSSKDLTFSVRVDTKETR